MNYLLKLLLLLFPGTILAAETVPVIIQFNLPANGKAVLTYADSMYVEKAVAFYNPAKQDSAICKRLDLTENTFLRSGYAFMKNGKLMGTNDYLLRLSADTVTLKLDKDYKLITCDAHALIVNDIINLTNLFTNPSLHLPAGQSSETWYAGLKQGYEANLQIIDKLRSQGAYNNFTLDALTRFAQADYYNQLFTAAVNHKHLEWGVRAAKEFAVHTSNFQLLHSIITLNAFMSYIRYQIEQDGLNAETLGLDFDYAIRAGWNKDITLGFLNRRMEFYSPKSDAQFQNCFNRFKNYAGISYNVQVDSLRRIYFPVVKNPQQVYLIDKAGRKLSLKEVISRYPGKVTLIDFWASWCAPCRQEAPLFEVAKKRQQNKHINFVSISLDEDEKTSAWLNALKQDKLMNASNHYKLLAPKRSVLFQSFTVQSIPRYIIVNSSGKILDSNFSRPSDKDYEVKLANIQVKL
ncbi:hypothetical protein GCM10027037_32570 [Mucilaginibacter koreensis]